VSDIASTSGWWCGRSRGNSSISCQSGMRKPEVRAVGRWLPDRGDDAGEISIPDTAGMDLSGLYGTAESDDGGQAKDYAANGAAPTTA
jgi:hypothetical protein